MRGFLIVKNTEKHLSFIALFVALILPPLALVLILWQVVRKSRSSAAKTFDRFVLIFSILMLIPFAAFVVAVLKVGNFTNQAQAQARPITLAIERNDSSKICSLKNTAADSQNYKVYYESFRGDSLQGELEKNVNEHSFTIHKSDTQKLEATNGPSRLVIVIHRDTSLKIPCENRNLTKNVSGSSRIIELTMTYKN